MVRRLTGLVLAAAAGTALIGALLEGVLWLVLDARDPAAGPITAAARAVAFSLVLAGVVAFILLRQHRLVEGEAGLLRAAVEALPVSVVLTDLQGRIQYVNPAFSTITGYLPEEALGSTPRILKSGLQDEAFYRRLWKEILGGRAWHGEVVNRRKDGSTYIQELTIQSVPDPRGRIAHFVGIGQDVTEKRQAVASLEAQEKRFRSLVEHSADGIGLIGPDTAGIYLSPAFTRMLQYPTADWLGRPLAELIHPEDLPRALEMVARGLESPGVSIPWQLRFRDVAGEWHWMEGTGINHLEDPAIEGIVVNWQETTERVRAEQALRASEARHRALLDGVPDEIAVLDGAGVFRDYRAAITAPLARPAHEFLGHHVRAVLPEEAAGRVQSAIAAARGSRTIQSLAYAVGEGATARHYEARVVPMEEDTFTLVTRDITSSVLLEAQLRQAQKVEAIGQLTGGIAHDFNNILMAIIGYTDFLMPAVRSTPALEEDVREIRKAADRAAVLTRQLLAFSRRQVLVPQLLDLNALVTEMGRMLDRLIGEDIGVSIHLADDLDTVRADPGQVEQVIMNLVLNARDAMSEGGTLAIGTGNAELDTGYAATHPYTTPGKYVSLWVTDSGTGMSREVMSHLFEPFFTTKPLGKGTGLGLATVYGIVKQSGGHISVYSEPGQGSTFKVYLPRVEAASEPIVPPPEERARGGQERLLVVDDDESVRMLVHRLLSVAGYEVISADGPIAAIEAVRAHAGQVDLLLTDVVMPGRSGRALAEELVALLPGLKVLYMSGYTQDAIVHRGVLDPGVHFVSKPVAGDVLLRAVRGLLDAPRRP